jgi:methylmalonyl-CoA mutase
VVFGVSLGTHFFKAIAKLRALRLLWAKVVLESGGSEGAAGRALIRARTSRRVMTAFDPWVNLLRNTVCCFAGAVGGADVVTTAPMDAAVGPSDEFSRRLARNTQAILQEESRLNRVIDPAGGSYFLETLTAQLAEKAWGLFRELEGQGGMLEAVRSGWVAGEIDRVEKAREKDLATRKQAITGISEHPNIHEEKLERPRPDARVLRAEAAERLVAWKRDHRAVAELKALEEVVMATERPAGAMTGAAVAAARAGATIGQIAAALAPRGGEPAVMEPLAVHPYAAAYEELRAASELHAEKTGRRPRVFLANLGTPAEFIGRSTFAMNFFEAGGFEEVNNDGFADAEAAAKAFVESGANIAVICSTDAKYDELAVPAAVALKAAGARAVVLAGNPGASEARYREGGIDRFIYIRCDVLGTLRELLREEGVLR